MSQILVIFSILSNFWRTLEMALVTYGINLIVTWSENCVICEVNRVTVFSIKMQNFMFLLQLYQLKIIQNYFNN